MELVKEKLVGAWRTAMVQSVEMIPQEGEIVFQVGFLTRNDGQASGEVAVMPVEMFAGLLEKLGAKKGSQVPGRACLIFVRDGTKEVVCVDHLFSRNPVEG